jgi:tRNA1Val (adenine37-N6)-methyltransferase
LKCVELKSFEDKAPFRHIISFMKCDKPQEVKKEAFCIYQTEGVHSLAYRALLKNFFIIF